MNDGQANDGSRGHLLTKLMNEEITVLNFLWKEQIT